MSTTLGGRGDDCGADEEQRGEQRPVAPLVEAQAGLGLDLAVGVAREEARRVEPAAAALAHEVEADVHVAPALVRVVTREDVLWNRPIFKAPPLAVRLPAIEVKGLVTDVGRTNR